MKKKTTYNLTVGSFSKIFNEKVNNLPSSVKKAISNLNFRYRVVEDEELNLVILNILKTIDSKNLKPSGPHRLKDWEKGWQEHLDEFQKSHYDPKSLVGIFANRGAYVRLQGRLIKPESDSFESDFVAVLRLYLFNKFLKKIKTLYEFGAGTGVNLQAASKIYPDTKLVGLDWAKSSVDLINTLQEKLNMNVVGKRFDLFNPDISYQLGKDAGVLTIGTLEQLGKDFRPFINYLLKNKPKICIHLETLFEAYDSNNLLDYLAIKYLEQRNYLKGFLTYLRKLEQKKIVKILKVQRTFGSTFHEGYTYTIWQPI